MSLDHLSDELIVEVAKQLESIYHDNRSLGPLVLCSRRLNNIISPLLYRTFTQVWNKLAAIPNLLRLVMEKPRIGAEIRTLVLREIAVEGEPEELDISGYSAQDFERCRTVMDSFAGVPIDKSEWMATLERGNWDAVVSLLLFFLPLLEGIEIEAGGLSSPTYLNQVIKYMASQHHVQNPSHSLKHLKSFSTAYWDTEGGMGIYSILPFCALPSLTTVRANCLEEEDGFVLYRYPPEQYHVQNLRIENSCVGGNTMKDLLSCFTSLQKFYYEHGGAIVGMAEFLPQRIGEGLAHLHNSLQELVLLSNEIYGDEPRQPLGDLAEFKKLRCIRTEAEVLFGLESESVKPELANILPASLEILDIRSCEDDIYPQLRNLISHGKQRFPVLKTVTINIPKAQVGGFNSIGPDGVHAREEEVKQNLKALASHPDIPDVEKYIKEFTDELERIQLNKPSKAEWEEWRTRQGIEKELIIEFKEAGIDLRFGLPARDEWTYTSSIMFN